MLATLSKHRRFVVTGLLVFFSLFFMGFFSESDRLSSVFQGLIVSIVFFLVIPLLYSKMVLRESLKNIGLQRGDFGAGVVAAIASLALALAAVIMLAFTFPQFRAQYALPALVENSFLWFVFYELILVSLIALLYAV